MFKNWKSTFAFFVFVGVYVYTVATNSNYQIIDATGDIALISSIFMMLRSDFTADTINKLVDNIKIGK